MYYYKFTASTQYVGTDNDFYIKTKEPLTPTEIKELCDEYARDNGEQYEYMLDNEYEDAEDMYNSEREWQNEWDNGRQWYRENLSCECEEIAEEEYNENN